MFSRKLPVVFISKNFIEPGRVILSREPFFEGVEARSYTEDTLGTVLASVDFLEKAPARIVLAEELVYVIALSFPSGTDLTRDLVREKAEEMVPEDLEATQWDFRTMRYVKQRETKEAIWVQVAVMERNFARALESAIGSGNIAVTSIVPESYALASFTASEEGISVIVEQDRENTLFIACESGLVLVTEVKKGTPDKEMVFAFVRFVEDKVSEQVTRIVFSHGENEVFREPVEQAGYRFEMQTYNPLLAAAFEKISGSDERVLNLNSFQRLPSSKWWNIFRKTAS